MSTLPLGDSTRGDENVPGALIHRTIDPRLILHPVLVGSVVILIVNDHLLKSRFPGFVTGKLSDIAGLVFFPALAVTVAQMVSGGRVGGTLGSLAAVCAGTATLFAAIQIVPFTTSAYELVASGLLWLVRLPVRLVSSGSLAPRRAAYTADPTDLLAVPFAGASWLLARIKSP